MSQASHSNFKKRVFRKLQRVAGFTPFDEFPHTRDIVLDFPHVEVYYWRPQWTLAQNFGDHLSKMIVARMLSEQELSLEEETSRSYKLFAIGSVMHFANDGNVIWGTGVNGCFGSEAHQFQSLDVRAVRGKLTREFLQERGIEVPEVYGDPALLLPHIFPNKFKRQSKSPYSIIPHHTEVESLERNKVKNIISPMGSWNKIISQILEADFVISSSLHGIIVAEAYGIPARYLRISSNQDIFKYNDYMSGTERGEIEYATSVEQALEMGGQNPIIDFDYKKLLNAFPFDLWK